MTGSSGQRPVSIYVSSSRFDRGVLEALLPNPSEALIVSNNSGKRLTEEELIQQQPRACVGIIAGLEPLSSKVIDAFRDLQVIARLGAGLDTVDLNAAALRGITVHSTPDATTDAVAELTLGLMIAQLRGILAADSALRKGVWQPVGGGLLKNRAVGVIGFGRIGQRVTELLSVFGARVRFYDPHFSGDDERRCSSLVELLSSSDVVTLHAPLTPETRGLLSSREIELLRPGCVVINVARGGLIDESALEVAVRAGRIRAAVDCYAEEPYIGPLRELEGIVLTPHIGSLTAETRREMEETAARLLVDELVRRGVL